MTDQLERMEQLLNEIATQAERMKMLVEQEDLSPQVVMLEMQETVMSLVADMAATAFNQIVEIHQYLHDEVEPALFDVQNQTLDESDPSQLMPEDADELLVLLNTYKASLIAGLEVQQKSDMPDAEKAAFAKEVAPQIDRVSAMIDRVEEIRLDFSDDGEDDAEDAGEGRRDTVTPSGDQAEATADE